MKKVFIIVIALLQINSLLGQEKRIITSDSVSLYVKIKGEGIPCLYIHGGPGSGSYWAEKFTGDIFEKQFQMIYLDQRGCCRSSVPKVNNYSLDRMVQDFEEVRKALGIEKWVLMGHSFAGLMQMGYAKKHPDVIAGMVMINVTLNWKESMEKGLFPNACKLLNIPCEKYCNNDSVLLVDRAIELVTKLNEKDLMWKMGYASKENFEIMAKTFSEVPNGNWESAEYVIKDPSYEDNFKKYAKDIDAPVLFFYGKKDINVGLAHYKDVYFPNMLLWGADCGHTPFMEAKDELNKAITRYRDKYSL